MDPNGIRAPLLPLERHISLEGEVTTPPRGGGVRPPSIRVHHIGGGGGGPAPGPQGSPRGERAVPRIFSEVRPRDGGPDRRKEVESPVDVLY